MKIYTIYKAINITNGMIYIGFDKNWPNRRKDHLTSKKKDRFHSTIRKYGKEIFVWEIIYQSLDKDHTLNIMEPYFIKEYNSYYKWENGGYNMTLGGEAPMLGKNHSEESKLKIGLWSKGKNNPMFGSKRINHGAKYYIVINPNGESREIFNLKTFCKENNLHNGNMVLIAQNKIGHKTCKGWRCSYG